MCRTSRGRCAPTHALLAGIRALVNEPKLRFISGRPPKAALENPMQMLLEL